MTRLRWLITLPLAIVLVVFAVNNRGFAEVDLWPLGLVVSWPLFVFVFLGVGAGLLLGWFFAWISAAPARKPQQALAKPPARHGIMEQAEREIIA